jgi:FlaA1/EpsC-like NDP-sugar epimerase
MLINRATRFAIGFPRFLKQIIAIATDVVTCIYTVWLAFGLRLDQWGSLSNYQWWVVAVSIATAIPIFYVFGLYRTIFRHTGLAALGGIVRALVVYGFIFIGLFVIFGVQGVPRTIGIIQPILLLIGIVASRLFARYLLRNAEFSRAERMSLPRALIYGAGSSGRQLASALAQSEDILVVGFLDDDPTLHKNSINGLTVYSRDDLPTVIAKHEVTDVLLALPSVNHIVRGVILAGLQPYTLRVRTLPALGDLTSGRLKASDLRDLDIDDLLGRDAVPPNLMLLNKNTRGKTILVTGAGGSIGSELCRQIVQFNPSTLLLVERSEFALYSIHEELKKIITSNGFNIQCVPLLASIQNEERMSKIICTWMPHIVYHAAAYKHVPLVEHNPIEGMKNNILGTLNCAKLCAIHGVSNFVLISTDKAVRPTNIMGASKRMSEMILQALACNPIPGSVTNFSMVRFGNVLGSSGSVVPMFSSQIKAGGPITLTDPDITRFFMTIPEAAQLVIQAGAMAEGGEVFVLDMGDPIRIVDLAHKMIELSGLSVKSLDNPHGDIEIHITGLRPGEKLYEELLIGDSHQKTIHPKIMKAQEVFIVWSELKLHLESLEQYLAADNIMDSRKLLLQLVDGYKPNSEIVDWVHLAKSTDPLPDLIL